MTRISKQIGFRYPQGSLFGLGKVDSLRTYPAVSSTVDYGPYFPSSGSNTGPSPNTWGGTGNILATDGSFATTGAGTNRTSAYLTALSFGIPTLSGTLNGITVTINKKSSGTAVTDATIQLVKGGVVIGSNSTAQGWTSTATDYIYGGPTDLWGTSLTLADLHATDFGVVFAATLGVTTSTGFVDSISVSFDVQSIAPTYSTGIANGLAIVSGVGKAIFSGIGSAAGAATVSGSTNLGVGSTNGASVVNGVSAAFSSVTAIANGLAIVSSVGKSVAPSVGAAAGVALTNGSSNLGVASVDGVSIVIGNGRSFYVTTGNANGDSLVKFISGSKAKAQGAATTLFAGQKLASSKFSAVGIASIYAQMATGRTLDATGVAIATMLSAGPGTFSATSIALTSSTGVKAKRFAGVSHGLTVTDFLSAGPGVGIATGAATTDGIIAIYSTANGMAIASIIAEPLHEFNVMGQAVVSILGARIKKFTCGINGHTTAFAIGVPSLSFNAIGLSIAAANGVKGKTGDALADGLAIADFQSTGGVCEANSESTGIFVGQIGPVARGAMVAFGRATVVGKSVNPPIIVKITADGSSTATAVSATIVAVEANAIGVASGNFILQVYKPAIMAANGIASTNFIGQGVFLGIGNGGVALGGSSGLSVIRGVIRTTGDLVLSGASTASMVAKFTYVSKGVIHLTSDLSNPTSTSYRRKNKFNFSWNIFSIISKEFAFEWNIGNQILYYYQIRTKSVQPNCANSGFDLSQDQDHFYYRLQNIAAYNLSDLCVKYKLQYQNAPTKWPIDKVYKYSLPVFKSDYPTASSTVDPTCNILSAPEEICNIPECFDFCVDFDLLDIIGVQTTIQDQFLRVNVGGTISLTGNALVPIERVHNSGVTLNLGGVAGVTLARWQYVSKGYLLADGSSNVVTSNWHYAGNGEMILDGNASIPFSNFKYIASGLMYIFGNSNIKRNYIFMPLLPILYLNGSAIVKGNSKYIALGELDILGSSLLIASKFTHASTGTLSLAGTSQEISPSWYWNG
jgi:hypothetical protein